MRRNSGQRIHNREENKNLANLVEQHPQLYDRDHVFYGKINAVEKAWKKIAKMWQKPVPECKRRWRNIRAAYARSIDAYKTKHGRKTFMDYYLAKEMKFLKPHLPKEVAAIDTARDEPILTEHASEAAQNNGQNNGINNSEAGANENNVHDMNNAHTHETFANVFFAFMLPPIVVIIEQ
ncbi:uncharacterized protein LOC125780188 [Bactrocera dorsalis]|uniref:Uncharacterized protein LOC125780188 n=1 Tax=Bactrocera dorsalis TaxID=27457 RepID=A0ABM3K8U5_BACDO|nr:uncharacterized protein LOC125780188 [Bactrocera dorsalis]